MTFHPFAPPGVSDVGPTRPSDRAHRRWFAGCLAIGLFVVGLGAPSPSGAQDSVRARARAAFEEGVRALDEGRFSEAVDLLARSLELRESAPAHYNRALALRGAGRYREAIQQLERYMEVATEPRHRRARALAEELLEELRAALARVDLEVVGDPETVELNGSAVEVPDGVRELTLDPGRVRIVVRRHGYEAVEREVELGAGETLALHLDAAAHPLPSHLVLEVDPTEASIFFDDRSLGTARAELETTPGVHDVRFEAAGHATERRQVELSPGDVSELAVRLTPLPVDLASEWWFWTAIGGGVALVAVVLGVSIAVATEVPPIENGTLGFSQEVLLAW